ncbi:DUF3488 and transglutaminase-like domain-containing protein [Bermanella sp. WJH001]|uniref:transglutaminase family protein n=1 Tax=Bermanella sp. WJH001 TaxID=3048005 RepID=UPI0024BEAD46|nr:DUF3488 and transglutaminase-like domain-containing protein [Bermanella sp. WJH001]MDJ1536919.1 DUF3488 and transglutaminase-like domain-containing protein [Bermanella sp. WJH001]
MAISSSHMSQTTLMFLFVNVFAALLLHLGRLPVWLIVFSITALVWRLSMFTGRVPKANWFIKLILVSSGFIGIYYSYGATLTIEGMVSLLIAGVMLKPLEVSKSNDSYLLIFLNYFLCALLFLFDRTPLDFLLVIFVMVLTLASQVLVHFYDQANRVQSIKTGLGLLLKSIPLALVLFFVLPRIGPLWTLNIPTQSGVVGLSDSMSPGSIAQLGKNNELAFRVKILEGDLPMNQRYWRTFTLNEFDGQTWQVSKAYQQENNNNFYDPSRNSNRYEVMVEPHEKNWLFALGAAKPLTQGITIQNDATLRSKRKLYNQWQYQVGSNYGELLPQTILTRTEWLTYTYLPEGSNPKAKAFAQQLKQQADNLPLFIEILRSYISTQGFNYTLSPGMYDGDHQIDDFLFESKSGFCSYYAGSLAFLLRSINVPSRVVVGYMGGEDNEISQTMSIYQRDAHAWVEVFIEGQGWLRLDPTAWVSPERVESGLQQAIPNEFQGFNTSAQWLKDLRKQWQAFDYLWNEWMLSYKGGKQQALLQDLWGKRNTNELIMLLLGVFIFLGLGLFGFLWWDQRAKPLSNEKKIFNMLLAWLQDQHSYKKVTSNDSLTMGQLLDKLQIKYPHLDHSLLALKKEMARQLYYPDAQGINKQDSQRIIKLIKILKKQTS